MSSHVGDSDGQPGCNHSQAEKGPAINPRKSSPLRRPSPGGAGGAALSGRGTEPSGGTSPPSVLPQPVPWSPVGRGVSGARGGEGKSLTPTARLLGSEGLRGNRRIRVVLPSQGPPWLPAPSRRLPGGGVRAGFRGWGGLPSASPAGRANSARGRTGHACSFLLQRCGSSASRVNAEIQLTL